MLFPEREARPRPATRLPSCSSSSSGSTEAIDTRRQQRVEEKRAEDDRAKHEHRPVPSAAARPVYRAGGAASKDDGVSSFVPRSRDGRRRTATRAMRRPVLRRVGFWCPPRLPDALRLSRLLSRPVSMNVAGHARRLAAPSAGRFGAPLSGSARWTRRPILGCSSSRRRRSGCLVQGAAPGPHHRRARRGPRAAEVGARRRTSGSST